MLRTVSLCLVGVVILACYAVPYGLMGEMTSWKGAFLFWLIAGAAIIVLNALATTTFTEDAE